MVKLIAFCISLYLNTINLFFKYRGGKQAFLIFCYPFPIKLKPKQQAFFDTAENFTVDFRNKKIACYKWGTGEKKVLCIHGWQSQSYRWRKYINALVEKGYTVFALDAPGHGNSDGTLLNVPVYANLIMQVIDEWKPNHVLAHSLGAHALLYVLSERKDLTIEKVCAMGAAGEAEYFVEYFQKRLKLSQRVMTNMLNYFQSYAGKQPSFFSAKRYVSQISQEGLLIHDRDDDEVPHQDSIDIHESWKNSKLILTEGLGHKLRSLDLVDRVVEFFD